MGLTVTGKRYNAPSLHPVKKMETVKSLLDALDKLLNHKLGSLENFSSAIGVKQEHLLKYLYNDPASLYSTFHLSKKSGGVRTIKAPKRPLKEIQRSTIGLLEKYYTPKSSAHGFVAGRSVKTNALPHVAKKFVFNIDLKDFFESIHFGRIRNLLMKPPFDASYEVAVVIAHLCCHKGRLAQGAPTSPLISNMICRKIDSQLQALAHKRKCHYTRYVDDISFSFSCTGKYLPKDIVEISEDGVAFPGAELQKIIESNGFGINPEKTRLKHRSQRQMVTGLIVNEFPNLPRKYIRRTASQIQAMRKHGAAAAELYYVSKLKLDNLELSARQQKRVKENAGDFFIKMVKGRLNYIKMIRGKDDSIYRRLAYQFTVAIGKENREYLKSPEEVLGNSVFLVTNIINEDRGTAFLLDGVGLVTNYHVVDGADYTTAPHVLTFSRPGSNKEFSAELVFFSKSLDLAVLRPSEDFKGISGLQKAKKEVIRPLDPIMSIGFPQHVDNATHYISKGSVTQSRKQNGLDVWLVDIPLVKGNSGGPIFNSSMEVIGIATVGSKFGDHQNVVYGFIPVATLSSWVASPEFRFNKMLQEYTKEHKLKPVTLSDFLKK